MSKVTELKEYFRQTLSQVSEILDIPEEDITRDDYVRITVDHDIENRLNKEELKAIGGYAKAKQDLNLIKGSDKLKVLILDIETIPLTVYSWGLFDQTIGLDMIIEDWSILSFSAKWLGDSEDKIMYQDVSGESDYRNDYKLVKTLHSLLDEADVTISQNGVRFDIPKIQTRFLKYGMKPPSSFRNIDTLKIAKKHFSFTSNKLAYMTDLLCTKYKKLSHSEFSGFKLWSECLKGNKKAYASMKKYNSYDVLSLEELYYKLRAWDKTINFNIASDSMEDRCDCGSKDFKQKGFIYTNAAKYKRYICSNCGKEYRNPKNILSKTNKSKLR